MTDRELIALIIEKLSCLKLYSFATWYGGTPDQFTGGEEDSDGDYISRYDIEEIIKEIKAQQATQ